MWKLKVQEFQVPGTMSIHKITWSTFNLGYTEMVHDLIWAPDLFGPQQI